VLNNMNFIGARSRMKTWVKRQSQEAIITGTERWWNSNMSKLIVAMSLLVAASRLFGVFLSFVVERATKKYRHSRASAAWRARTFTRLVQGALYTPALEHGRIEKRTLFEQSLDQLLHENEAAVESVMEAAQATTQDSPLLTHYLPASDKWHVLNAALNQVSAVHAPFYTQADILPQDWLNEWYVIAMFCEKKEARGRRFVGGSKKGDTPAAPETGDVRSTKVICVKEDTLGAINEGGVTWPTKWQNGRHAIRAAQIWCMSQLYARIREDPSNAQSKHLLRLSIPAHREAQAVMQSSAPLSMYGSSPHSSLSNYSDHPLVQARRDPVRRRSWADFHSHQHGWEGSGADRGPSHLAQQYPEVVYEEPPDRTPADLP